MKIIETSLNLRIERGKRKEDYLISEDIAKRQLSLSLIHIYTSCEKGTVECHNRMLRRFIPKGKSIVNYSADERCV